MTVPEVPSREEDHPYRMTISLNVLNHLGIGLYSNVPAVLSEVVANAWDADAENVSIDIDVEKSEIIVQDDGNGMSEADINHKYLNVGYRKRDEEPGKTEKNRDPMGRKGIGKLSVFSIAETVEVYSAKSGERHALRMNSDDIQEQIKDPTKPDIYYPKAIDTSPIDFAKGTKIILKDLKKGLVRTEEFLRRRLARRFSIVGVSDFEISLNGAPISAKDRGYYDKIEFLWHTGDREDLDEGFFQGSGSTVRLRKSIKNHFQVDDIVNKDKGWTAKGWIGTVDEQKNIDEDSNIIIVFARGKLIHEDVLGDLKEGGVYSKYLVGEIDADFMDVDDKDDIVTSDRQSVKEDDERYEDLKKFIQDILKKIQNQWTDLRNETGTERALQYPGVKAWYEKLQGDKKNYARKLFGKIESLKIPDMEAKKELYRSSLLAFERLALKDSLSTLDSLETPEDLDLLARLFGTVDEIESVHYYEIAKGRLEVVKQFEEALPQARERLLQQHIFDHLWLLDPSWERAASNHRIEQAVTKEFDDIDVKLSEEEKEGRIDIRYKTAAGKHIIIELKKYDRSVAATDLVVQVRKYRDALNKCLRTKFPNEPRVIESICILGKPPTPHDDDHAQENIELLKRVGSRYIIYDELIQNTLRSYEEYIERQKEVSELIAVIDELNENFQPASLTQ